MKLAVVVASENALPSAFAVFRGIEKSAEIIHRLGYDGMELALKESDEITHDELRSILKKNSLEVSAISTGQVFAARGLMFTDPDKERREELWKSFTGFVDLASEFGGLVNVGRVRGSIGKRDKNEAEGLFLDLMGKVADYAEKRGVTIILEPVNRYEIDYINSVDQGAELVRKMNKKNFALMPDVFHMNIEDALNLLDDLGIALWLYDDGSLHKTKLFYNLNTQGFSEEVNKELFVPFFLKFGIKAKPTIERKKDGREFWYLRVGKYDGAYEISELLNKYKVNCFDYKVWSSETIQNWSKLQEWLKSGNNSNCSTKKKSMILKKIEQGEL